VLPDDAIRRVLESRIADIETAGVGYVVSYDSATRTANIQQGTRRPLARENGEIVNIDRNVLQSIPVMFPGGGGCSVTWPIEPGDSGLLVCLRYSAQAWRAGDGTTPGNAGDLRPHHESNAVFFPGWKPDATPIVGSSQPAFVIEADEIRLGAPLATDFVTNDTKIQIELGKIQATLSAMVSAWGANTGAPVTITPYAPAATALTKVKGV
jgi:hypothetical protein